MYQRTHMHFSHDYHMISQVTTPPCHYVQGFMREMQSPNLPDALKGKEKLVFGNIQAVYEFHHK